MPSVLVVDDSPVDRRLAMALLEKQADLTVDAATHGAEALAWVLIIEGLSPLPTRYDFTVLALPRPAQTADAWTRASSTVRRRIP